MRAHGASKKLKGPRKHARLERGGEMSTCCALSHFTYSGHIIRFMLQCKLAAWLSGYIIWEPSLKSTEAGDGNWRIYVSWHALLAHCPPPLSLPASSLLYTAIFNPIFQNWQPYIIHILLSPLFFSLFLSVFTHFLQSLCTSPSPTPTPTPNLTFRLHPAPLCRKVAQLLSGAPDKGSFYFWWGFERIKNVSQCVWAIMIVDRLLRMNQPDKCTGGKKNDLTNTLEATLFTGHLLSMFYFQIKNEVMHIL